MGYPVAKSLGIRSEEHLIPPSRIPLIQTWRDRPFSAMTEVEVECWFDEVLTLILHEGREH